MIRTTLIAAALAFTPVATLAQTPGEQSARSLEKTITKTVKLGYLLYLPKEYGKEADRKWPLLLFLHGSGESGSDLEKVKVHGPPMLASKGKEMPFILVSPQSPGGGWNNEALGVLLDEVQATYSVDPDRVYVTGLSMGGYGTWALAMEFPQRFAAIAPICGGGQARRARMIAHIPAWVFHGAKDSVVPVKESEDMVEALKRAGASPRFTVYPEANHDSWTETYNNRAFYEWLLEQKRRKP